MFKSQIQNCTCMHETYLKEFSVISSSKVNTFRNYQTVGAGNYFGLRIKSILAI